MKRFYVFTTTAVGSLQWRTPVTNCVEQNHCSEASNRLACQEIPNVLRNSTIHYCVQKGPSLVPVLRRITGSTPSRPTSPRFILVLFILQFRPRYSGFPLTFCSHLSFPSGCYITPVSLSLVSSFYTNSEASSL